MTTQPSAPTLASTLPGGAPPARRAAVRQAAVFVGLVYLLVITVALALPYAGIAPLASMVTPLVALGIITAFLTPRGRRRQLWGSVGLTRLGLRSWPVALLVPIVVIFVIPYGAADLLGSAHFRSINPSVAVWITGLVDLVISLAIGILLALTEEIGWRGYLLPRVQALLDKRRAALAVGFIHGLFHLPLILLTTTYDSVGSRWIVAPVVVATLTAAGVLYAWLKDRSGSVWPVAVAHSSVNAVIDGAGVVVITAPVALAYTASESGLVTLLSVLGAAVILLWRRSTWHAPRQAAGTS